MSPTHSSVIDAAFGLRARFGFLGAAADWAMQQALMPIAAIKLTVRVPIGRS
jgi:hypothetical protein